VVASTPRGRGPSLPNFADSLLVACFRGSDLPTSQRGGDYQLRLGRQRQVWLIPIADERVGVQVKL